MIFSLNIVHEVIIPLENELEIALFSKLEHFKCYLFLKRKKKRKKKETSF